MLTCYESTTTAEEAAAGLRTLAGCAGSVVQSGGLGATPLACIPHPTTPGAKPEGGAVEADPTFRSLSAAEMPDVSPDVAAAAWLAHLEAGRPVPDSKTLISLLKAMLEARALRPISSGRPDVKLIQIDTGKKFPHMLDTANGTLTEDEAIWTQVDRIAPSHPHPRDRHSTKSKEPAHAISHSPPGRMPLPTLPTPAPPNAHSPLPTL